jgi:hypothetical protein
MFSRFLYVDILPCALKHGYGRALPTDPLNHRMVERGRNVRYLVLDEADRDKGFETETWWSHS